MKMKFKPLLIAFFIFFFLFDILRDLLLNSGGILNDLQSLAGIGSLLTHIICFFGFFGGAYWVFFKTWGKNKKVLAFALLPLIATFFIGLRYFLQEVMGRLIFGLGNYSDNTSLVYYYFDNLYYAILYISVGSALFFVHYSQQKEARQQELILQNQKTELAFLRSQLNPHFLFNILNNIYSLIYFLLFNLSK